MPSSIIADEAEHWITLENGAHVLLSGSGKVEAGAGGHLNGKALTPESLHKRSSAKEHTQAAAEHRTMANSPGVPESRRRAHLALAEKHDESAKNFKESPSLDPHGESMATYRIDNSGGFNSDPKTAPEHIGMTGGGHKPDGGARHGREYSIPKQPGTASSSS